MAHGYQGGKRMAYSDEGYQYETGRHGGSMAYSDTTGYSGGRTVVAYTNSDDRDNAGRHGGRMVYADERHDSGRHGGYSNADNYDRRRRPAAVYDNDNRYGDATDVYTKDMDMQYAKKRTDGDQGYYRRGLMSVAGGQKGYYMRGQTERMGDVRVLAGGTVYPEEYSTVAGGQQKRADGARTQRREMLEAMAAIALASGSEQGEKHHISSVRSTADTGFSMHKKHKPRKMGPEDAQAHIIKEAMATAVTTGSDYRKKETSKNNGHKQVKRSMILN